MPSLPHEIPLELFREDPDILSYLLKEVLGVDLPDYQELRVERAEFSRLEPTQYRADLLVTGRDKQQGVVFALVVEVQRRIDPEKLFSWPLYVASAHKQFKCKTGMLVLTFDDRVATWAGRGPGTLLTGSFHPWVLGPSGIPVISTIEEARRRPPLALLSLQAHAESEEAAAVAAAALAGAADLPEDDAKLYVDLILSAIPDALRREVEAKMNLQGYEYQSDFAKKYVAQGEAKGRAEGEAKGRAEGEAKGRAEGLAEALLRVLRARGIAVSDAEERRILSCQDKETLDRWLAGSVSCESAAELLGADGSD